MIHTFSTSYGVFTLVSKYPLKPNQIAMTIHTIAIIKFIENCSPLFGLVELADIDLPFILVDFSCVFPFAILIILK